MNRKGFTLIELVMVMALSTAIMFSIVLMIQQVTVSSEYLNGQTQVIQWGQIAIDEINFNLTQARVNYQNDTQGNAYRAALDLESRYPALTTTRLACIDQMGTFYNDVAPATRTGNALLFIKESNPYIDSAALGITRSVNTYYLVYYYLSPNTTPIAKKNSSLRLVRWQSKEFADYQQIMAITPAVSRSLFANVLQASRNINYYLIPGNDPDSAFYKLDDDGAGDADSDGIDDAPDAAYVIEQESATSVIGNLGMGRASVSWNKDNDFWVPDPVPKFGALDATGAGFPHGLEVQIIGPTGARQVFVRLVLAYYVSTNQTIFSNEASTIATMHEF
ncbi:MAG: type II secretion system protein [Candidatus Brocadiia bacterium]